jgi:hypothetical protein
MGLWEHVDVIRFRRLIFRFMGFEARRNTFSGLMGRGTGDCIL